MPEISQQKLYLCHQISGVAYYPFPDGRATPWPILVTKLQTKISRELSFSKSSFSYRWKNHEVFNKIGLFGAPYQLKRKNIWNFLFEKCISLVRKGFTISGLAFYRKCAFLFIFHTTLQINYFNLFHFTVSSEGRLPYYTCCKQERKLHRSKTRSHLCLGNFITFFRLDLIFAYKPLTWKPIYATIRNIRGRLKNDI